MREDDIRNCIELSQYRLERAKEDLDTAKRLYEDDDLRAANNRAYYSIFHALRTVLALEAFDSKKHSGIISHFRQKYIKTGIFPMEMSDMIGDAFEIRNASDYNDMFVASRDKTKKQIKNAEFILVQVRKYIGTSIMTYRELFDKEGTNKDSQIINMTLVSLFSSDTLMTENDCDRSERELLKIKWALENAKLPDDMKAHWMEYVLKGIDIIYGFLQIRIF